MPLNLTVTVVIDLDQKSDKELHKIHELSEKMQKPAVHNIIEPMKKIGGKKKA